MAWRTHKRKATGLLQASGITHTIGVSSDGTKLKLKFYHINIKLKNNCGY